MTKSLKTLIRLAKRVVDKEQETLGNLQGRWDKFNHQKLGFLENLAKEAKVAEENPELSASFGSFASATQIKIRRAEEQMKKLDSRIEFQREKLREAFAEQKKYEIALENKERAILEEQRKQEQKTLDEIAIQRHSRN